MTLTQVSKFLSLILRHKPEWIGITLDEHGWADVGELVKGISKETPFDETILEAIVRTDKKKRYQFNEDHTKIRACQGHSIPVDLELTPVMPPEFLWHGTGEKYVPSIERTGLQPKSRQYVHLSPDKETAGDVGKRHGAPVIYRVLAGKMHRDGYSFYQAANGVWLTRSVPKDYLCSDPSYGKSSKSNK